MLTEFQNQKLTHLFNVYDTDGNSTLTENDFVVIVDNIAELYKLEANSPEAGQIRARYLGFWQGLQQFADADQNMRVNLQEWFAFFDHMLNTEGVYQQMIGALAKDVISVFDSDGNDKLGLDEYQNFFSANSIDVSLAEGPFASMDSDGDGYLSEAEVLEALHQFYHSEDVSAPGNSFFGPIG
ncbi:MAG: EF-hand domain-containing protein [Chloroflexota bacterium]